ncbi:MAG: 2-dehydropantoate 2-reductase [Candidatus Omnitrophica bacterium]|nr:2-dehydropantoate 2-reductase [Candidatus Omnitrophota bacterium]
MKIAVIGCGAIGGTLLAYLSRAGADVRGVMKSSQLADVSGKGLRLEGARGAEQVKVRGVERLGEPVDLAVCATKIPDLEEALERAAPFLRDAVTVTTQNGVAADAIAQRFVPRERILSGVVMFGATYLPPAKIVHHFEGPLLLGNPWEKKVPRAEEIKRELSRAVEISFCPDILGAKYLKLFVNLNNCVPAVLGCSLQEAFSSPEIAEIAVRLNREAYRVVAARGIVLQSLPTYPKERLEKLVSLPVKEAAGIFSRIMQSLSETPVYGSVLQSIRRGRRSEIDYLNGEIVRLAAQGSQPAFYNRTIVDMVHSVEQSGRFFSREELVKKMEQEKEAA